MGFYQYTTFPMTFLLHRVLYLSVRNLLIIICIRRINTVFIIVMNMTNAFENKLYQGLLL